MLTALAIMSVLLLSITIYAVHRWLVTREELLAVILYLHKAEVKIDPGLLLECVREING